ncbi:uncharacterized protein LOC143290609 isoform X2 [Babylonia areolata]
MWASSTLLVSLALCFLSRDVAGKPIEKDDTDMDILTRTLIGLDKEKTEALSAVLELLDSIDLPSLCLSLTSPTSLGNMDTLIARAAAVYDAMKKAEQTDRLTQDLPSEKVSTENVTMVTDRPSPDVDSGEVVKDLHGPVADHSSRNNLQASIQGFPDDGRPSFQQYSDYNSVLSPTNNDYNIYDVSDNSVYDTAAGAAKSSQHYTFKTAVEGSVEVRTPLFFPEDLMTLTSMKAEDVKDLDQVIIQSSRSLKPDSALRAESLRLASHHDGPHMSVGTGDTMLTESASLSASSVTNTTKSSSNPTATPARHVHEPTEVHASTNSTDYITEPTNNTDDITNPINNTEDINKPMDNIDDITEPINSTDVITQLTDSTDDVTNPTSKSDEGSAHTVTNEDRPVPKNIDITYVKGNLTNSRTRVPSSLFHSLKVSDLQEHDTAHIARDAMDSRQADNSTSQTEQAGTTPTNRSVLSNASSTGLGEEPSPPTSTLELQASAGSPTIKNTPEPVTAHSETWRGSYPFSTDNFSLKQTRDNRFLADNDDVADQAHGGSHGSDVSITVDTDTASAAHPDGATNATQPQVNTATSEAEVNSQWTSSTALLGADDAASFNIPAFKPDSTNATDNTGESTVTSDGPTPNTSVKNGTPDHSSDTFSAVGGTDTSWKASPIVAESNSSKIFLTLTEDNTTSLLLTPRGDKGLEDVKVKSSSRSTEQRTSLSSTVNKAGEEREPSATADTSLSDISRPVLTHDNSLSDISRPVLTHDNSLSDISRSVLTHDNSLSDISTSALTQDNSLSDISRSALTQDNSLSHFSRSALTQSMESTEQGSSGASTDMAPRLTSEERWTSGDSRDTTTTTTTTPAVPLSQVSVATDRPSVSASHSVTPGSHTGQNTRRFLASGSGAVLSEDSDLEPVLSEDSELEPVLSVKNVMGTVAGRGEKTSSNTVLHPQQGSVDYLSEEQQSVKGVRSSDGSGVERRVAGRKAWSERAGRQTEHRHTWNDNGLSASASRRNSRLFRTRGGNTAAFTSHTMAAGPPSLWHSYLAARDWRKPADGINTESFSATLPLSPALTMTAGEEGRGKQTRTVLVQPYSAVRQGSLHPHSSPIHPLFSPVHPHSSPLHHPSPNLGTLWTEGSQYWRHRQHRGFPHFQTDGDFSSSSPKGLRDRPFRPHSGQGGTDRGVHRGVEHGVMLDRLNLEEYGVRADVRADVRSDVWADEKSDVKDDVRADVKDDVRVDERDDEWADRVNMEEIGVRSDVNDDVSDVVNDDVRADRVTVEEHGYTEDRAEDTPDKNDGTADQGGSGSGGSQGRGVRSGLEVNSLKVNDGTADQGGSGSGGSQGRGVRSGVEVNSLKVNDGGWAERGKWREATPYHSYQLKEEAEEAQQGWKEDQADSWSEGHLYGRLQPRYEGYACPGLFGFFGDILDCRSFFICSWGVPYRFYCPSGTLWNPARSVCDWSRDVVCPN